MLSHATRIRFFAGGRQDRSRREHGRGTDSPTGGATGTDGEHHDATAVGRAGAPLRGAIPHSPQLPGGDGRPARHRARPGLLPAGLAVGRQRARPGLRRVAAAGGSAGRHRGASPSLHGRARHLRRGDAHLRAGPERHGATRHARCSGARHGPLHPGGIGAPRRYLLGGHGARPRPRHLERGRPARRDHRAARRGHPGGGAGVAVGLLHQRPGRRADVRLHAARAQGTPRSPDRRTARLGRRIGRDGGDRRARLRAEWRDDGDPRPAPDGPATGGRGRTARALRRDRAAPGRAARAPGTTSVAAPCSGRIWSASSTPP